MKKVASALILSSLVNSAAMADNAANSNKAIMLDKQQTEFTITLPSNPTTGYSWFLKNYDANLVQPVKQFFVAPKEKSMGAGGTEMWTFKTQKNAFTVPQTTQVTFIYAQPWNMANAKETVINLVTH